MDGGSSRIDPSSDNFDLLFKLIIIGDTGAAARSKCPGSQRLTRRRGHPPAHRPSRLLRAAPRGAVPQLGRRRCACALVHCVHKVARCYCCCNHGPSAPLAAPALGSCASQGALSGLGRRALREHRPAHPQPLPPLLELSAFPSRRLPSRRRWHSPCCFGPARHGQVVPAAPVHRARLPGELVPHDRRRVWLAAHRDRRAGHQAG